MTNYRALARRRWPVTCWIDGNGPIAVVAYCRITSVSLWRDQAAADAARAYIDYYACGGMCNRRHDTVDLREPGLDLPPEATP